MFSNPPPPSSYINPTHKKNSIELEDELQTTRKNHNDYVKEDMAYFIEDTLETRFQLKDKFDLYICMYRISLFNFLRRNKKREVKPFLQYWVSTSGDTIHFPFETGKLLEGSPTFFSSLFSSSTKKEGDDEVGGEEEEEEREPFIELCLDVIQSKIKIPKETMRNYLFQNDYNSHYKGYTIVKDNDTNTNKVFVLLDMTMFSIMEEEEGEPEEGKWIILDEVINDETDKTDPLIHTLFHENPEIINLKHIDTKEPYYRPLLLYLCKWNETTQTYENVPLPESKILNPLYIPPRRIHPVFGACYVFSRRPLQNNNTNNNNIEYITVLYNEDKTVHLVGMEEKDAVFPPETLKMTENYNLQSITYTEPVSQIDMWICKNRDAFQLSH